MLLALSAVLAFTACTNGQSSTQASNLPTNVSAEAGSLGSAPLETAAAAQGNLQVPVYWIGRTKTKAALYREFLPLESGADPIQTAVQLMTSSKPLDPDYSSPWSKPSKFAASLSDKNVITVDLSADAFSKSIDNTTAQLAIQELVYTVTGAAANAGLVDSNQVVQVSILVDGHTDFMAFDQVKLDRPISRDATVQAPIWVISPQQGAVFNSGVITVTGLASVNLSKLNWLIQRIEPGGGRQSYQSGSTALQKTTKQGNFSFSISPPPGNYELVVFHADSSASASQADPDSKAFSVR
ncbi:GerMN domain-containing protein [Psychromicrobium lacuslunae]|uniref:GerMN domain-containing protein n=1 Tax=Psychromicrobium lacuslunae TaxID=1618207 RepID=UPI000696D9AA|nr:GerMN domain-containing protein [Psychromicrobium lacuslunae]